MGYNSGVINFGGAPGILENITAARPPFGLPGRLFLDTTLKQWQRDTGAAWVDIGATAAGFYAQGGNSFGANAVLGTNDNFPLIVEVNNNEVARFAPPTAPNINRQFSVGGVPADNTLDAKVNITAVDGFYSLYSFGAMAIRSNALSAQTFYYFNGFTAYSVIGFNGSIFSFNNHESGAIDFIQNATIRARIAPTTGQFLIGTSTLSAQGGNLQLFGTGLSISLTAVNAYTFLSQTRDALSTILGNSVRGDASATALLFKTSVDPASWINLNYITGISFHTNLTGAVGVTALETANEVMRINLNQRVLIGKTTDLGATYKLQVAAGGIHTTGDLTTGGGLTTLEPSASGAGYWKFGVRIAAATVLDATQYLEVSVNGTVYKLALIT